MSQNNPTAQQNSGRSRKGAESACTKGLSAPLCEAKWSYTFTPNATLSAALEHARTAAVELTQQLASAQEAPGQGGESGSASQTSQSSVFQGIAYTTSGAKAIVRIDAASGSHAPGIASDDGDFILHPFFLYRLRSADRCRC